MENSNYFPWRKREKIRVSVKVRPTVFTLIFLKNPKDFLLNFLNSTKFPNFPESGIQTIYKIWQKMYVPMINKYYNSIMVITIFLNKKMSKNFNSNSSKETLSLRASGLNIIYWKKNKIKMLFFTWNDLKIKMFRKIKISKSQYQYVKKNKSKYEYKKILIKNKI